MNLRVVSPFSRDRQGNSSRSPTPGPEMPSNADPDSPAEPRPSFPSAAAAASSGIRQNASSHSSGTAGSSRCVRFGNFHLDLQTEELFRDGVRVKLQGKVYQALLALLERPGEIVTREELRMKLWPAEAHVNYDANVNTTVNKLRQVLGGSPGDPNFVETVPRKGYSFVAKVAYTDEPGPRPPRQLEDAGTPSVGAGGDRVAFFGPNASSKWFTAGVISLILAGMLFGAAVMMFVRHVI